MKEATRKRQSERSKEGLSITNRRTPKTRKKTLVYTLPPTRKMVFPEVIGKTIEALKLYFEHGDTSLSLAFSDKTHLYLDLEPRLTVRGDLSDGKTGNYRPIKKWPPHHSRSAWTDDSTPGS